MQTEEIKQDVNQVDKKLLTKKDVTKSWWLWWISAETTNSFERLQSLSFCLSMLPVLKKLYPKKQELSKAMKRHLQFFNTQGIWGSAVPGITIAMEEQKAQGLEIPDETITSIKSGLMGPFAGIGDTIDWATLLPIVLGFFIPVAERGSWVAGIIPILIFAAITAFEGYSLWHLGYRTGQSSAIKLLKSGGIQKLITGASILGLLMMGGLAANYVNVTTPIIIPSQSGEIVLQEIFDSILPGLLPLLTVTGVYMFLEKVKRDYLSVTLIVLVAGLLLGTLGIL